MGEEERHKESAVGELALKLGFGECFWDCTLFIYLFVPILKADTPHSEGKGKRSAVRELFL